MYFYKQILSTLNNNNIYAIKIQEFNLQSLNNLIFWRIKGMPRSAQLFLPLSQKRKE